MFVSNDVAYYVSVKGVTSTRDSKSLFFSSQLYIFSLFV